MNRQIIQLGKHSIVYGIGQILQRLAGFLLIPLYTTYYTPTEYGIQEILLNTSTVMTTILGLGMLSGLYRAYFTYDDEVRRLNVVRTALSTFVVLPLAVGGVCILFAEPLSVLLLSDASFAPLLILTIVYVMLSNIVSLPFAVLRARSESVRFVTYSLVQFLVNAGATTLLIASFRRGIRGNLEGNVLGQITVLLLFAPLLWKLRKAHFSWIDLKEMLTFGLPLVPALLGSLSLTVADRYFLRAFAAFDTVGVYGLGYKVGMAVQVFVVTPFILSWSPVMWSVANKPYANRFYAKVLTYYSMVSLYAALAISILGPQLLRLLSRQAIYWKASPLLPLITLSYVLYGVYSQVSVGLNLRKKTQYLSFIMVSAALLNLLLNFLLIPPWGMMGAAWATLVSYAFLATLTTIISQHFYPFAYEWNRLAKLGLTVGLCYGVSLLISADPSLLPVLLKVVLLLLFPAVLWLIRFFPPEEINRGKEILEHAWGHLVILLRR